MTVILAMVENQAGDCMFPESWNEILIAVTLTEEVFWLTEVRAERKKKMSACSYSFWKILYKANRSTTMETHTHRHTRLINFIDIWNLRTFILKSQAHFIAVLCVCMCVWQRCGRRSPGHSLYPERCFIFPHFFFFTAICPFFDKVVHWLKMSIN